MNLSSSGFFALGATPLDDAVTDPPILGAQSNAAVTPTVWNLVKESLTSEGERATGPNYPITFSLTLDIANGETVQDISLEDVLPESYVYVANSVSVSTPGAFTVIEPVAEAPQSAPNNRLAIDLGTVTGTTGVEAVVTYQAWIAEQDALGNDVIDPINADDTSGTNDSQASGVYEGTPIVDDSAETDFTVSQQAIAIQKYVSIANDVGATGVTPGDTLEYVLNLQISDYFEFGDLVIDDTFGDGQLWDAGFAPSFVINEQGATSSGTFLPAQFTLNPIDTLTGDTLVEFDLSSVISGGILTGDLFADATREGATTVTVRFRTVIQEDFQYDFPSGDPSVDTGDSDQESRDCDGAKSGRGFRRSIRIGYQRDKRVHCRSTCHQGSLCS